MFQRVLYQPSASHTVSQGKCIHLSSCSRNKSLHIPNHRILTTEGKSTTPASEEKASKNSAT